MSTPTIQFGTNAKQAVVSKYTIEILKEILNHAGLSSCKITSTSRTPADQARVMYNNIVSHGVSSQKKLYAATGDMVIDVYVLNKKAGNNAAQTRTAMENKIIAIGPEKVSRHCADPKKLNVVDVAPSSIGNKHAFENAVNVARKADKVSRFITPNNGDPAYHIEIPQTFILDVSGNAVRKINHKFFYDHLRLKLFGGSFDQSQVDGLNVILEKWEVGHSDDDDRWLAYILGTVHHETDKTFEGITEYGSKSYFKKYDGRASLGNDKPGDGYKYRGRGFVQLTGKANYTKFATILGIDLIKKPELALEIDNCVEIIFYGMMKGTYTGKKLSDYFNATVEDWYNARRIVNSVDKANLIKDYALQYYAAISYTT